MVETKTISTEKHEAIRRGLLVFAITFLVNPCVNVFDYLPDFVGYFIIAKSLVYYAQRLPHFEEARTGFLRLACVSLAKIPAYFFMVMIRGQNTIDNDIKSLFTFSLTAIETVLLVGAIKHLFDALTYLGERGCAASLIEDFSLSKSGKRKSSPDALRIFCYVFAIYKFVMTAFPEMLLLTKTVEAGSYDKVFNVARLYPYAIIISVVSVFVMGIVLTRRFSKYLGAISAEGLMKYSVEELFDDLSRETLSRKLHTDKIKVTLTLFLVASFLTVDINVDNLFSIDAVPNFIFGILVILASIRLSSLIQGTKMLTVIAGVYSAVAMVAYYFQVDFLTRHGYDALVGSIAKSDYIPVIAVYSVEFALLTAVTVTMGITISKLAAAHTGIERDNPNFSRVDLDFHKKMQRDIRLWTAFGILSGATKLAHLILRYFADSTLVAVGNEAGIVTSGLIPWFNLVVLFTTVLFVCYSLHLFGELKEEVELKYS